MCATVFLIAVPGDISGLFLLCFCAYTIAARCSCIFISHILLCTYTTDMKGCRYGGYEF